MIMKKIMALALCAALLLGCAACGEKPARPTDAPQKPEGIVVAISSEPGTLDPTQGWGHGNTPLIQSTLIKYASDMSFANDLATDYSLDASGRVWTFVLRTDAKYTDGKPVTAQDVVFTYETAKKGQSAVDLSYVEKIEAPDDHTVVFTLDEPTSIFLNTVASVGIVPRHAYDENYGTNPMGSGPWKFVQWNPQEQLILEANPDYYGQVPHISKVTLAFMDEDAAFAAVKAGEVDVALTAATLATASIEGYHVERIASVDNRGFTLPMTPNEGKLTASGCPIGNDVTCNLEIRQAMAHALDRELIARVALNGFGTPCYSENDGMPWNNPEVVIQTDVDYAKQLLAQNGWSDTDGDGIVEKDGLKAEIPCVYPSGDSVRQAVALAAAQQLRDIGINLVVEGTSWDDVAKRMFSSAVMMGWGAANPYETYCIYHSSGAYKDDFYNPEGYMSPVTDGYLSDAMKAPTTEQAYDSWKLVQWDGKTGTSMKGLCPWVWIVNIEHLYYVRDGLSIGVQKLHPHGSSMPLLQNLNEWQWIA